MATYSGANILLAMTLPALTQFNQDPTINKKESRGRELKGLHIGAATAFIGH